MKKSKDSIRFGCNWCYSIHSDDIKLVQVRAGKNEWQSPIHICSECRKHLIGQFRYVKEKKNV